MIEHIEGTLLDFPGSADAIIHQTNISNIFGAGLARAIKDKWPHAVPGVAAGIDLKFSLGEVVVEKVEKDKYVINCYAQSLYTNSMAGCPTSYDALVKCLTQLAQAKQTAEHMTPDICGIRDINTIAIPMYMGCGLGGGRWNIYYAILTDILSPVFNLVFVNYVKK
jgi:O-acetyl-ADP-ribose deacetylase (regulator of RNase III)